MIRVEPAPEPDDFEELVALPGRRLLMELIGDPEAPKRSGPKRKAAYTRVEDIPVSELERMHYWTEALPHMRACYHDTCAYLAMKIHPSTGAATIDHFVSKNRDRRGAYDWHNFRLAAALVNAFKDEHEVVDPFVVDPESEVWFVLNLLSFEVTPNPELEDATLRERIRLSIVHLRLNEPTFCETRRYCHDRYLGLPTGRGESEPWPLSWLEDECPFVARELRRQDRLRPGDT